MSAYILAQLHRIFNLLISIGQKLDLILDLLRNPLPVPASDRAIGFRFDAIQAGTITEGASQMDITDSQQFTLTLKPVTVKGKPAAVEAGSVEWSGPTYVEVTPAADGMSALIRAIGVGDGGFVTASADADLGAGVSTISGQLSVNVTASQATSLGFDIGPVEQQP